ncbi:MAG: hypothetical protein ACI8QC_003050 [Planctomycetota bacterium]|jgi:hypothetical protein
MNPSDAEGQEPVDETLKLPIESGLGQLKRLRDQALESDHTPYENRGEIGRGGSFRTHPMDARTGQRYGYSETNAEDDVGLRPARAVTR